MNDWNLKKKSKSILSLQRINSAETQVTISMEIKFMKNKNTIMFIKVSCREGSL